MMKEWKGKREEEIDGFERGGDGKREREKHVRLRW